MKIVKILGGAVIVLLLIAAVAPAFISNSYWIEKNITVNASAAKIYGLVGELKEWGQWNYWMSMDPDQKITYGPTTSGAGGSLDWDSQKSGVGTITIDSATQDKDVTFTLDFGKMGKGTSAWKFSETSGTTNVNWVFQGDSPNYIARWFNLIMSSMMEEPMNNSLSKLKEVAEAL